MSQESQKVTEQIRGNDVTPVDAIVAATKIPRGQVFTELRRLEKRGLGKLVYGRRGNPSRFIAKQAMHASKDMEKKVNDLWEKFKTRKLPETKNLLDEKLAAAPSAEWEIRVQNVQPNGDLSIVVNIPPTELVAFMESVRAKSRAS